MLRPHLVKETRDRYEVRTMTHHGELYVAAEDVRQWLRINSNEMGDTSAMGSQLWALWRDAMQESP